jgi:hypothetical protein
MIERLGVGTDTAGALLVAAGENSNRIHNGRSFARLCGAAPLDASSGKQQRHRLSRAGDRHANGALWRIVITRLSYDPATRSYLRRPWHKASLNEKPSAALKRYAARELDPYLPQHTLAHTHLGASICALRDSKRDPRDRAERRASPSRREGCAASLVVLGPGSAIPVSVVECGLDARESELGAGLHRLYGTVRGGAVCSLAWQ